MNLLNKAVFGEESMYAVDTNYASFEELDAAIAEDDVSDAEVSEIEGEQELLEGTADKLEETEATVESLFGAGQKPMTKREAMLMQLAVQNATSKELFSAWGSMEDIDGEDDEVSDEVISTMENKFTDTVLKIWNAIKRAVTNAIRAIIEFFQKLFGGSARLEKGLKELAKEYNKFKSAKTGEERLPFADRVCYNNQIDDAALAVGATAVKEVVEERSTSLANAVSVLDAHMNVIREDIDLEDQAWKTLDKNLDQYTTKSSVGKQNKALPGNNVLVVTTTSGEVGDKPTIDQKDAAGTLKYAHAMPRISIQPDNRFSASQVTNQDTAAVDIKIMVDILGTCAQTMKIVNTKKSITDKISDKRKKLVEKQEKLVKKAAEGKVSAFWTGTRVNTASRSVQADLSADVRKVYNFAYSYCRAVYNLAKGQKKRYS